MKKLLILFVLTLLPLAASASLPVSQTVSKARLTSLISEIRGYDGVEVVRLGALPTAAIKTVLRTAARRDEDAKEALRLLRGVRRVSVLDYEDCSPAVRERISARLDRALVGSELLMEAKDDGEVVRMYTVGDSKTIESFVMIAVDGGEVTFICLDGQMPRDETEKLIIEATKN